MLPSPRPSSHRYQVTAECGESPGGGGAMTAGLGWARNSMSSGGSGDLGMAQVVPPGDVPSAAMSHAEVVVVGSVNADLVVSVARLPRAGETVVGGTFARWGGGKGANQAVAAARAGARVAMVGAVGADDLGEEALRELEAEGTDVSAVARGDGGAARGAAVVGDARGEKQNAVAS